MVATCSQARVFVFWFGGTWRPTHTAAAPPHRNSGAHVTRVRGLGDNGAAASPCTRPCAGREALRDPHSAPHRRCRWGPLLELSRPFLDLLLPSPAVFTSFSLPSHCLPTAFPLFSHRLSTVPRCSHSLIPPLSSELGSSSSPSAQGLTRTARRLPPHHPRQEPPAAHGAGAAARKTSPPPLPSPRPLGHWAVLHRWIAFIVHLVISCYLDLSHLIAFILCRVRTGHRRDDGCRRGAHFLLSLTFHCLAAAFP